MEDTCLGVSINITQPVHCQEGNDRKNNFLIQEPMRIWERAASYFLRQYSLFLNGVCLLMGTSHYIHADCFIPGKADSKRVYKLSFQLNFN